jgi:hypothetical protein
VTWQLELRRSAIRHGFQRRKGVIIVNQQAELNEEFKELSSVEEQIAFIARLATQLAYLVEIMNPPFLNCDYLGRIMFESEGDTAKIETRIAEEFRQWQEDG